LSGEVSAPYMRRIKVSQLNCALPRRARPPSKIGDASQGALNVLPSAPVSVRLHLLRIIPLFLQFLYSFRGKPHGRIYYTVSQAKSVQLGDSYSACAGAAPRATRAVHHASHPV
jgi:hypothetical protein